MTHITPRAMSEDEVQEYIKQIDDDASTADKNEDNNGNFL